jgi:hypothetical protein
LNPKNGSQTLEQMFPAGETEEKMDQLYNKQKPRDLGSEECAVSHGMVE